MNQKLVELRKKDCLTQEAFSQKLGITMTYYSKIEVGVRNPSYNFLIKFKKAYPNESIDDIFFVNKSHSICRLLTSKGNKTQGK